MNSQELANLETLELELEFFEPITRARSNTWPLPRPEEFDDSNPSTDSIDNKSPEPSSSRDNPSTTTVCSSSKKKQSTRNAHGGTSYAELITQAISGAKDQRLTLSDIYAWMIEHVPTIKDREGSTGWRNSVRHNLSLHNRFVRVPNESAGKSSWWTINPNEIFGKSTRRRSASMEAKKYQASRCRAKKAARGVKTGETNSELQRLLDSIGSGEVEQSVVMYVDAHELLQPIQNASRTVGYIQCGRLSPIPAVSNEAEWTVEDYGSREAVLDTYDNRTSTYDPCLQTTTSPFVPESQPSNGQTLTKFNSFLDDVTDIISKEMTDCKLKII